MKLTVLMWVYWRIHHWLLRVGEIEDLCPSCHCDTDISALTHCECGAVACSECITDGEDCSLCPACYEACKEDATR